MDLDAPLVNEIIASKPFANSTRIEGDALFSPDGGRIAFGSDRSGHPEIWVAARDGSGLQQITALGAAEIGDTAWSPDGAHIGFDAAIAGNSDVYVVGSDGGKPASADLRPRQGGTSIVVGRWALDLFRVDTRRRKSGRVADDS
jgi:dipeptidyl aminopeptidase/acylaminoacyl peptidase